MSGAAAWGESLARALRLIERLADHIERKRAAHRAAVAKKAIIDAKHVERRPWVKNDPRPRS